MPETGTEPATRLTGLPSRTRTITPAPVRRDRRPSGQPAAIGAATRPKPDPRPLAPTCGHQARAQSPATRPPTGGHLATPGASGTRRSGRVGAARRA
jgi:hypothetical protein